jgi:hypothetical protein
MACTSTLVAGTLLLTLAIAAPAGAQTFSSGSTGQDGAFNPTVTVTVPLPPSGVFHFTTITIPAGVTVRFAPNTANTPVTLLASDDVTINGTIDVSGSAGGPSNAQGATLLGNSGPGGPGGFAGGSGSPGHTGGGGGAGLGPGGGEGAGFHITANGPGAGGAGHGAAGGNGSGDGAGAGGPAYGSQSLLPLLGGSGGGGGGATLARTGGGGGGGGGAIVIASSTRITLGAPGQILARGGAGGSSFGNAGVSSGAGGSGGAVRLVAPTLAGSGQVDVRGGAGGFNAGAGAPGRVRVEAFSSTLSVGLPGPPPEGAVTATAPTPVTLPTTPGLRIASVGGVPAPPAPAASFTLPDVVLPSTITAPVSVVITATHVPPGTTVNVSVKGHFGAATTTAGVLQGTVETSTTTVGVTIPADQPVVITASAAFTLTAAAGGPVVVRGEAVERVRVTATLGGTPAVAYVTRAGREVPAAR